MKSQGDQIAIYCISHCLFFCIYMIVKLMSQTYSQMKGSIFSLKNCPKRFTWRLLAVAALAMITIPIIMYFLLAVFQTSMYTLGPVRSITWCGFFAYSISNIALSTQIFPPPESVEQFAV